MRLTELKPSVVIRAMINGLRKQHVKVKMSVFGYYEDGVCFGCAATNALCEIKGEKFIGKEINKRNSRAMFMNIDRTEIARFEISVDALRRGMVRDYDYDMDTHIPEDISRYIHLPCLNTHDWQDNLGPYEELANRLEKVNL